MLFKVFLYDIFYIIMHIFILLLYNMNNENNEKVAGLDRGCGCKLCEENFDHREKLGKFKSTITGTAFDTDFGDVGNLPPCKIDCVIYMITCSNCDIQYVGQTKKQLRYRVYGHRNSCKNKSEQILYKHFNSECKFEMLNCSVQKTYLRLLTIGLALARASAQLQDSNIPPTGRVAGVDTLSLSVL